ncbi:Myb-related protein A [Paramyrothecium foliicola]|nr:Myb-related protein A [Paramyrothecium foliicola]
MSPSPILVDCDPQLYLRLPLKDDRRHTRNMSAQQADQPVKKQSKWSPEEDALIIELRGSGMKWEDISKRLPGRSAISCRLHYQNYLERRSEWDEERKNKLARLYERFKSEMWAKVAEELACPWRAAEAMHWHMGELEMARRAGVTPFSLTAVNVEGGHRHSPARTHSHTQSQGNIQREMVPPQSPHSMYNRPQPVPVMPATRPPPVRRDHHHAPPPPPPSMIPEPTEMYYSPGPGLPPIQNQPQPRGAGLLPGVAELTTGVSPYSAPAAAPSPVAMVLPPNQAVNFPPGVGYAAGEMAGSKRRASPESMRHEMSNKRRLE